jgi:heptosyltransferase I
MMSAVGDAVQVLPVLNALRRRFPDVHLTWLIQPGPHELVEGHPAVDRFVLFQRGRRSKSPGPLLRGASAIRNTARDLRAVAQTLPSDRFDLLLDLQVYFKAGILTALAPARLKLGFDFRRTRDLNWLFTSRRIPTPPGRFQHTQEQYLEFLHFLGVDPEPVVYGLRLTEAERQAQTRFFSRVPRPACGLVLATSDPRKDWPVKGYLDVVHGLHERFGLQPILLGGLSHREISAADEIMANARVPVVNALGPGLRRLLWMLDGCALILSPDTGPLHMARALEVPVVGLYGFTNPKRSGPFRMYRELLVDGYARYPGEDYPLDMKRRREGMRRITPEMVLEKVALAVEVYGGEWT